MNKLLVTLYVSELKDLINETIESKLSKYKITEATSVKIELPKFLTRQEVAKQFQVSLVTIDKWRRCGLLPKTIKQAGSTYFLSKDIEKFVEEKVSLNSSK